MGRLQKYPKIHVSTGEESSCSGPDSTQGLRPRHRRERNPERPPRNSHGDWPFLSPPERVPEVPVKNPKIHVSTGVESSLSGPDSTQGLRPRQGRERNPERPPSNSNGDWPFLRSPERVPEVPIKNPKIHVSTGVESSLSGPDSTQGLRPRQGRERNPERPPSNSHGDWPFLRSPERVPEVPIKNPKIHVSTGVESSLSGPDSTQGLRPRQGRERNPERPPSNSHGDWPFLRSPERVPEVPIKNPKIHVSTGVESSLSGPDSTQGLRPRQGRERNPERPPSNSHGDWPFLRSPERVPEVPIKNPKIHVSTGVESSLSGPDSTQGLRPRQGRERNPERPPSNSHGDWPFLRSPERVPEVPIKNPKIHVSTGVESSLSGPDSTQGLRPRQGRERNPERPPSNSHGDWPFLRSPERVPEVPIKNPKIHVSTGVESSLSGPDSTQGLRPRQGRERNPERPPSNSHGDWPFLRSPERVPEVPIKNPKIHVSTGVESSLSGPDSTQGLRPRQGRERNPERPPSNSHGDWPFLRSPERVPEVPIKNPKIHVSTGVESSLSGPDSTQGLRPRQGRERNPERPPSNSHGDWPFLRSPERVPEVPIKNPKIHVSTGVESSLSGPDSTQGLRPRQGRERNPERPPSNSHGDWPFLRSPERVPEVPIKNPKIHVSTGVESSLSGPDSTQGLRPRQGRERNPERPPSNSHGDWPFLRSPERVPEVPIKNPKIHVSTGVESSLSGPDSTQGLRPRQGRERNPERPPSNSHGDWPFLRSPERVPEVPIKNPKIHVSTGVESSLSGPDSTQGLRPRQGRERNPERPPSNSHGDWPFLRSPERVPEVPIKNPKIHVSTGVESSLSGPDSTQGLRPRQGRERNPERPPSNSHGDWPFLRSPERVPEVPIKNPKIHVSTGVESSLSGPDSTQGLRPRQGRERNPERPPSNSHGDWPFLRSPERVPEVPIKNPKIHVSTGVESSLSGPDSTQGLRPRQGRERNPERPPSNSHGDWPFLRSPERVPEVPIKNPKIHVSTGVESSLSGPDSTQGLRPRQGRERNPERPPSISHGDWPFLRSPERVPEVPIKNPKIHVSTGVESSLSGPDSTQGLRPRQGRERNPERPPSNSHGDWPFLRSPERVPEVPIKNPKIHVSTGVESSLSGPDSTQGLRPRQGRERNPERPPSNSHGDWPFLRSLERVPEVPIKNPKIHVSTGVESSLSGPDSTQGLRPRQGRERNPERPPSNSHGDWPFLRSLERVPEVPIKNPKIHVSTGVESSLSGPDSTQGLRPRQGRERNPERPPSNSHGDWPFLRSLERVPEVPIKNPKIHVSTGVESSLSGPDSTQGLRPRQGRERNPERPPSNSHGDWPFLRSLERVPEVPIKNPKIHVSTGVESSLSGPDSTQGLRPRQGRERNPERPPSNSHGDWPFLRSLERVPEVPIKNPKIHVSTGVESSLSGPDSTQGLRPRQGRERNPERPPSNSHGDWPFLRSLERVPEVPIKNPKIHVSTGVESSLSGPDSTQGHRPRQGRERNPERPPSNSHGDWPFLRSLERVPEVPIKNPKIHVSTGVESSLSGPDSTQGLRPRQGRERNPERPPSNSHGDWPFLRSPERVPEVPIKNPKIHVSTGVESSLSGPDSTQGLRPRQGRERNPERPPSNSHGDWPFLRSLERVPEVPIKNPKIHVSTGVESSLSGPDSTQGLRPRQGRERNPERPPSNSHGDWPFLRSPERVPEVPIKNPKIHVSTGVESSLSGPDSTQGLRPRQGRERNPERPPSNSHGDWPFLRSLERVPEVPIKNPKIHVSTGVESSLSGPDSTQGLRPRQGRERNPERPPSISHGDWPFLRSPERVPEVPIKNPKIHVSTGVESSLSGPDSTQGLRPRQGRERNPERPPSNSHGDWPFLRSPERVPEVPIKNPKIHVSTGVESSLSGPDSTQGLRPRQGRERNPERPPSNSHGDWPFLRSPERVPEVPIKNPKFHVSTGVESSLSGPDSTQGLRPRQGRERNPERPPSNSHGDWPFLKSPERVPEVPIKNPKIHVSTGVESSLSGPDSTQGLRPRQGRERNPERPPSNSHGDWPFLRSPERVPEVPIKNPKIHVSTGVESSVSGPDSTQGLRPRQGRERNPEKPPSISHGDWPFLRSPERVPEVPIKNPKIHVSTGVESSVSGPDSTQGLRPRQGRERNPEKPPSISHGDWPFLRSPERVPEVPIGKNSRRSRRISRGDALHRKCERKSRVVPPFQESPKCVSPFQRNLFSLHCLDVQAKDRLPPPVHVGQPCWKASWESLVGKTRGKTIDPLIHAADCVTMMLPLWREAQVHARIRNED
ncbi:hypothetical protein MJG53_000351 [Ovis ammon polii x Ovis aries]|nr:hypothetical protein MJG53_000351 [Ovis ammon polii x Ovis aries]